MLEIKDIKHLAELSKLEFSEKELEEFSTQFESLVELANTIKNADIKGNIKIHTVDMKDLREDKAKESMPVDLLLANSPIVKKDSIVVPAIME